MSRSGLIYSLASLLMCIFRFDSITEIILHDIFMDALGVANTNFRLNPISMFHQGSFHSVNPATLSMLVISVSS